MQAIMETLFDIVYLCSVITIGILMIRGSRGNRQFRLFGWMAVILGQAMPFIWYRVPWCFAPQVSKTIRLHSDWESALLPLP